MLSEFDIWSSFVLVIYINPSVIFNSIMNSREKKTTINLSFELVGLNKTIIVKDTDFMASLSESTERNNNVN